MAGKQTRAAAKARGAKTYHGKACPQHPALRGERYTSNGACVDCRRNVRKATPAEARQIVAQYGDQRSVRDIQRTLGIDRRLVTAVLAQAGLTKTAASRKREAFRLMRAGGRLFLTDDRSTTARPAGTYLRPRGKLDGHRRGGGRVSAGGRDQMFVHQSLQAGYALGLFAAMAGLSLKEAMEVLHSQIKAGSFDPVRYVYSVGRVLGQRLGFSLFDVCEAENSAGVPAIRQALMDGFRDAELVSAFEKGLRDGGNDAATPDAEAS